MRFLLPFVLAASACADPASAEFSDGGPDTPAVPGMTYLWNFDQDAPGPMTAPWFSVLGDWQVQEGGVFQGMTLGAPEFPRTLVEGLQFTDLKLSVRCQMILGNIDRACGLMFRAVDSENYYVTRANALEGNIRLYRVVDGDRQRFASADRTVSSSTWYTLEVEVIGNRITVSWNGELVIDETDDTFDKGAIGLWTKADSITAFDDLSATAR
jgi:hypothetical protein